MPWLVVEDGGSRMEDDAILHPASSILGF